MNANNSFSYESFGTKYFIKSGTRVFSYNSGVYSFGTFVKVDENGKFVVLVDGLSFETRGDWDTELDNPEEQIFENCHHVDEYGYFFPEEKPCCMMQH